MQINLVCSNISFGEESVPPIVEGEVISYNGASYDFSPLLEGAEIEIGLPFTEPVKRINGIIQVSIQYFYSSLTAEPNQSTKQKDYIFEVFSGQCPDPIKRKQAGEESEQ